MKEFRANPSSPQFWEFIASGSTEEFKKLVIKSIISSYPHREFILIGDSGEHDPEVYGWAAGAYPDQVKEIYIRNVTQETFGNKRMRKSFETISNKVRLIDMNDGAIREP
jgi:phosphatidate phosphatase APP1